MDRKPRNYWKRKYQEALAEMDKAEQLNGELNRQMRVSAEDALAARERMAADRDAAQEQARFLSGLCFALAVSLVVAVGILAWQVTR